MKNIVYIVDTVGLDDPTLFSQLYNLLPTNRQQKIDRFLRRQDKCLSLCAGALLQMVIKVLMLPPETELTENESGKPYFKNISGVHFNLSHSGNTALCAVSDSKVGVDIEQIRHFEMKLAQFVFHDRELHDELLSQDGFDRYCTRLWTMKESVMKYYGAGLNIAPKSIILTPSAGKAMVSGRADSTELNIGTFSYSDCMISVCSMYSEAVFEHNIISPSFLLSELKKR